MFKFRKKQLIVYLTAFFCALLLLGALRFIKPVALGALDYPLSFLTLLRREISGMVFYRRNMINSEKLRKENGFLKSRLYEYKEAVSENNRLKNLLAFKQRSPHKVIAARVIARGADSWSSALIIDKGRSSGINRGFTAISYLGLVGSVVEVSASSAKIMLISDPNSAVAARLERSREEGLVSGTLGTSLVMKYLSADSDVDILDLVVTSGFSEKYPKGIIIGTVASLGDEFAGLSRYVVLKPAANLSNIEEVLIIIP